MRFALRQFQLFVVSANAARDGPAGLSRSYAKVHVAGAKLFVDILFKLTAHGRSAQRADLCRDARRLELHLVDASLSQSTRLDHLVRSGLSLFRRHPPARP